MKKVKKPVFFLVFAVIAIFAVTTLIGVSTQNGDITTTYVHGVKDIRLGIDIQGGVDVTFEPAGDVDATDEQMDAALEKIKTRLVSQGINDSDTYVDYKSDRIIVRFPWQAGETDFDPEQAVKELGETAELTFRYGTETTTNEDGETVPAGEIVLTGDDVKSAGTGATQDDTTKEATWMVTLDLNDSGTEKFYNATSALYQDNGQISIWMDNTMISAPSVNAVISDGKATTSGNFTYESAKELADKINGDCRIDHLCLYCHLHDFPVSAVGCDRIHLLGRTDCRHAGSRFRLVRLYGQQHADYSRYRWYYPFRWYGC